MTTLGIKRTRSISLQIYIKSCRKNMILFRNSSTLLPAPKSYNPPIRDLKWRSIKHHQRFLWVVFTVTGKGKPSTKSRSFQIPIFIDIHSYPLNLMEHPSKPVTFPWFHFYRASASDLADALEESSVAAPRSPAVQHGAAAPPGGWGPPNNCDPYTSLELLFHGDTKKKEIEH